MPSSMPISLCDKKSEYFPHNFIHNAELSLVLPSTRLGFVCIVNKTAQLVHYCYHICCNTVVSIQLSETNHLITGKIQSSQIIN